MNTGVYVLSCRLTFGPLWLRISLFLLWFLSVLFGLFLLHWTFVLPCQVKLPEFHDLPIYGCIRVLWLVFHPLGLELDKVLFDWNSVRCVECDLAEPESLASLGGSSPGLVDGILSNDGSEPIKVLIHAHIMVLGIF